MDDNGWRDSAQQAGEAIDRALGAADPESVVAELSEAGRVLDEALREAMAASAIAGTSMRRLAEIAGMAPNSVPPRLARSKSLSPYADEGSITSQGIAVARYDAASGRPPMTFKPRRKDSK
jgi:lambda repressor-like predicted transcriptional regulator